MESKYSSYEEIQRDLEIFKIEKEINFHKMFRSFDQLKEEFTTPKLLTNTLGSVSSIIRNSNGIQAFIITGILKFFFKRILKK